MSFPLRERGLKRFEDRYKRHVDQSFPLRERGLKHFTSLDNVVICGRSPCGNVD